MTKLDELHRRYDGPIPIDQQQEAGLRPPPPSAAYVAEVRQYVADYYRYDLARRMLAAYRNHIDPGPRNFERFGEVFAAELRKLIEDEHTPEAAVCPCAAWLSRLLAATRGEGDPPEQPPLPRVP